MKIFCSGIGGIGLSAYAAYQDAAGHEVLGSDQSETALIKDLQSQGIPISLMQDGSSIPNDIDLFVYSLALPDDHPEKKRGESLGVHEMTYFEALGALTKGTELIAVCGTSGKSSTTAMAAKVLIDAGIDPSVILGTKTPDLGGRNWRRGKASQTLSNSEQDSHPLHRDIFLVEACEYCNSFHHLSPRIVLLTNAYGDHFDAYAGAKEYQHSFEIFLKQIPSDGVLITHLSDPICAQLSASVACKVIDADTMFLPTLQVPGEHMQQNAQLVLALSDHLHLGDATKSLGSYKGCWRRMEIKGETDQGVLVIDDYGHHPNEVLATLEGLKKHYADRRLICVFQPHTHDRVKKLYDQFLSAFKAADLVIIPNIYAARSERDAEKVDPKKLVADIAQGSSVEVLYGESLEKTTKMLQDQILWKNDLLVTMGAGDVGKIAESVL